MKNSYKNFDNKDFIEFILENSSLTNYEFLGSISGRNIYLLY